MFCSNGYQRTLALYSPRLCNLTCFMSQWKQFGYKLWRKVKLHACFTHKTFFSESLMFFGIPRKANVMSLLNNSRTDFSSLHVRAEVATGSTSDTDCMVCLLNDVYTESSRKQEHITRRQFGKWYLSLRTYVCFEKTHRTLGTADRCPCRSTNREPLESKCRQLHKLPDGLKQTERIAVSGLIDGATAALDTSV